MSEVNLLDLYPKSRRPLVARGKIKLSGSGRLPVEKNNFITTEEQILKQKMLQVARKFGKEYFDGDRLYGYGGYNYHPKFWTKTAQRIRDYYGLGSGARILDVGCAKGYLLYDLKRQFPQIKIAGVDISEYAVKNAHPEVRSHIKIADAVNLPFPDKSFDLVVSINTVSNPPLEQCQKAIQEIMRVSRKDAFIAVHAWETETQKSNLLKWNLTAMTTLHINEWEKLFKQMNYTKDYCWSFMS